MGINVRDRESERDKEGNLGKAILVANEVTNIYKALPKTIKTIANMNIVNANDDDDIPAIVTIYISSKKEPTLIDVYERKIKLEKNATFSRSNVIMSANESVFMVSDKDNVVVRIEGFEDNPR